MPQIFSIFLFLRAQRYQIPIHLVTSSQYFRQIRYFLSVEMEGIWFGIMHSLNLILPRPDEDEKKDLTPPTVKPPKAIQPPSPLKPRPSRIEVGSEPGPGLESSSQQQPTKEKPRNFLKMLFQSNDSADDHFVKQTEEEEEVEDISDPDLNISIKERNLQYPLLLVKDYGRPLYQHLSRGSWELLVTSRCQMEEMVKILELEVSIVSHLPSVSDEMTEEKGKESGVQSGKKSQQSPSRWTLDPSIPIHGQSLNTTPPKLQNRPPQHQKLFDPSGDKLSGTPQSTSPRLKPSSSVTLPPRHGPQNQQQEIKTIQQRLDSHVNLPYHPSDENRFRRKHK